MVVDLIPKLAHWVHKEMQSKNHAKHTIPCLLLSVVAKKKVLGWALMLDHA